LTARPLTHAETALARTVFGDAIDYDRVRLANSKWAFFQPRHVVMAPRGTIHFHPRGNLFCDDFCDRDLTDQGLFIHEMTHVWQHQTGVNLILARLRSRRYDYVLKPGWQLHRYGIEQQAEIVRHWFMMQQGWSVPGAPPIDQYRGVIPFHSLP
jgi:hypothetical protein